MADIKTKKEKAKEITDKLEEGLKELIEDLGETKDIKELASVIHTIRETTSKLFTDAENQLGKIQNIREQTQEQEKESLLLIQHHNLSDYSMIRVRGMNAANLTETLSCMNNDDRKNISEYLKNQGIWAEELAIEAIRDFKEYHPDVWYHTDTNEVIDLTIETGQSKKMIKSDERETEQSEKTMKAEQRETDNETELLHSDFDKYGIYQLKDFPELDPFRFKGIEILKRMGIIDSFVAINPDNYSLIFAGELSEMQKESQDMVLETIYKKFNTDYPEDFKGHSLSVSDIVVLHKNGKNSAHFVDSFGFTELPNFMCKLESSKRSSLSQSVSERNNQKQGLKLEKAERMSIEEESLETEQIEIRQTEPETTQMKRLKAEPPEIQEEQTRSESGQVTETAEFEDMDDEDEIIDLGNEREQVLEEMKESLNRLTANTKTEEYMEQSENYPEEMHEAREKEPVSIFNKYRELNKTLYMEFAETEVTLTVLECSGFHNLGEVYSNIPTVDEAVSLWKQLSSEHRNSTHAIGIHIHTLDAEAIDDVELDILSGNKIHLTVLEDNPVIKNNPQVMEVVMELIAKLPEIEIDGNMSEIMEAAIWKMRMPGLTPAEQLAVELDRFACQYDTTSYHDNTQNMTEHIAKFSESIRQGDISYLTTWLTDVIMQEIEPEEENKAKVLLEKLSKYHSSVKIPKAEEQNYCMAVPAPDSSAQEKKQTEDNGKEHRITAAKPSLKARIAKKKTLVYGLEKEYEKQETPKKNQREV